MKVSVTDAKGLLTDLVRRAEAGEEVILTRHGHAVARLTPVAVRVDQAQREAVMRAVMQSAQRKALPGPDAAHSADFLYDEQGLPR